MQNIVFLYMYFVFLFLLASCSQQDPRQDRYLFSLETNYREDLKLGYASENISKVFEKNGYALSSQTTIETQKENKEWLICDKESKQNFLVLQDEELKVYKDAINLEKEKESRLGMDYKKEEQDSLFVKLDTLLKKWLVSHKQDQPGIHSATKAEIQQMVLGYFSAVVEGLKSQNQSHRLIASACLGFSDDVRSIPYLLEVLSDPDVNIRSNAALSLGQIEFSRIPFDVASKVMDALMQSLPKEANEDSRGMMAFAMSQVVVENQDYGSISLLLERLGDPSPKVRNNVVLALGKIKHEEGAKGIIAKTLEDPIPIVRYNSIRALSQIGNDKVDIVTPIIKRMRDKVEIVAGAAYHVLKNITGKNFGPEPAIWEEWAGITEKK